MRCSSPSICSCIWMICSSRDSSVLISDWRRAVNRLCCTAIICCTRGLSASLISSGITIISAPSCSASRRASMARLIRYCERAISSCERAWVSLNTSSVSPASTLSPSSTSSSRTMPPSRCCTVRLKDSIETLPGATTAIASEAVIDHRTKPPRAISRMPYPNLR